MKTDPEIDFNIEEPQSPAAATAGPIEESESAEVKATRVAAELAYEFFKEGRFSASTGPIEVPGLIHAAGVSPAQARSAANGFGAISVQAVAVDVGVSKPSVHVYLTHGTAKQIRELPDDVQGVPIRAHKIGMISVRPEASGSSTNQGHIFERGKRLCCGSSCGPTSEASAGTLGALVKVSGSEGIYLLSNNHVLAGCNHVPKGQPILAPASMDGRPLARAPGEIGRHDRIEELRSGHPAMVDPCVADLALALATDKDILSSWQGDQKSGYDTPAQIAEPLSQMKVKKFGRTTGLSLGTVQAKVIVPMPVTYSAKSFKGQVWFKDVWSIVGMAGAPFALQGDSGSLVVSEDGRIAVGIIFAASNNGETAFMIPMDRVRDAFSGLTLIHGHGL